MIKHMSREHNCMRIFASNQPNIDAFVPQEELRKKELKKLTSSLSKYKVCHDSLGPGLVV